MAFEQVLQYSDSLDDKTKGKILSQNFQTLQKVIINRASTLLAQLQVKTDQSITSSTFTLITGLNKVVDTSGGVVLILANMSGYNASLSTNSFGLFIDGVEKTRKGWGAQGLGQNICLTWLDKFQRGNHRFEIKALTTAGTLVTPQQTNNWVNDLYIAEFII